MQRDFDGAHHRLIGTGFVLDGMLNPLGAVIDPKIPFIGIDHLGMFLKEESKCPLRANDVNGLPDAIQNEDLVMLGRLHSGANVNNMGSVVKWFVGACQEWNKVG